MKTESDAISQHQVFEDLMELREQRQALPCHLVYKIKRDGAGNVQWFKGSRVCRGNHQIKGINYHAKFAPTARLGQVRLAPVIAAMYDLKIHHIAVCTSFLGANLEDEIYMHSPQGSFRLLKNWCRSNHPRFTNTSCKMILRLTKSHYVLK
jgi:hypothetical protein